MKTWAVVIVLVGAFAVGCGGRGSTDLRVALPAPPDVLSNPYMARDEIVGHVHKPNLSYPREWEEHPSGEFVFTTNNLGFVNREDTPLTAKPGVQRVLLTGDSHVEGVVSVEENLAAVLEDLLAARGEDFEILNAGAAYYTPHHYAAVLERFAGLEPDVYVVVVYSGNDFIGALEAEQYLGRLELPDRPDDYVETLKRGEKAAIRGWWHAGAIYQHLNQTFFFAHYPEYADVALAAFQQQLGLIIEDCRSREIRFVVAFLPTKLQVEYETDGEHLDRVLDTLGLTDADLETTPQLSDRLMSWLRTQGVQVVDLAPAFDEAEDELFWRRDYHLGVAGHRLLAEQLSLALSSGAVQATGGLP
jgi:hypothetical protein